MPITQNNVTVSGAHLQGALVTPTGGGTAPTLGEVVRDTAAVRSTATSTVIGRTTAGTGKAESLTVAQAQALLELPDVAVAAARGVLRERDGAAPVVYLQKHGMKRLDTDFGANNLTRLTNPYATSGQTDNATKFQKLLASLTGPTDFKFEEGEFYGVNSCIGVNNRRLRFLNYGARGTAGFVNYNTAGTYFPSGLFNFCTLVWPNINGHQRTQTSPGVYDNYYPKAGSQANLVARSIYAADGSAWLRAGATEFLIADADVAVGDTLEILSGFTYHDNYLTKAVQAWACVVAAKRSSGSDYIITTDRPLPLDIDPSPNTLNDDPELDSGDEGYWWQDSGGNRIKTGSVYIRTSAAVADPDYANIRPYLSDLTTRWDYGYMARDIEAHGLLLAARSGYLFLNFPQDSIFDNCEFVAGKCLFYGNASFNNRFSNIDGRFKGFVSEFSACSHFTTIEDSTFTYDDDGWLIDASVEARVMSAQEAPYGCTFRRLRINLGSADFGANAKMLKIGSCGRNNAYEDIVITNDGTAVPYICYAEALSDNQGYYKVRGNLWQGIEYSQAVSATSGQTVDIVRFNGTSNTARGVKCTSTAPLDATFRVNLQGGSGHRVADIENVGKNAVGLIASTVTNSTITRIGGSTTNSGDSTNTVVSGTPDVARWARNP